MFLIRTTSGSRRVLSKLQFFVSYCIFLLTFTAVIDFSSGQHGATTVLPKSGVCESKKNATCSHQVAHLNMSDEDCMVLYLNKSSYTCSDESFMGDVDLDYKYGNMTLLTYLYKSDAIHVVPAFNVTFLSIQWTSMRMRFKPLNEREVSFCREFQVSNVPEDFSIFFDCLWNDINYVNVPYLFQYQIVTPSQHTYLYKYFFYVPDHTKMDVNTKLEHWQIFSWVDMTDEVSRLSLTAQAAPARFNVSAYLIQLICQLWNNSRVVHQRVIEPQGQWVRFSYDTKSRPGIYHFTVQLVHPKCENVSCFVSKTPSIEIAALPPRRTLIMFVMAVILIPLVIMAYFLWRRKCNINVPTIENSGPPKFLLIYNPVSVDHIKTMKEVAKYFNKVCHVQAMMDELGIPQSESKDPNRWYTDMFNEADFVGIFASPKIPDGERKASKDEAMRYCIYQNCEIIAHMLLRHRLTMAFPGTKCKFFGVALPNSSWDTLPVEAQALKRYTLPRDLDPLLVLIGVVPQCDRGAGFMQAIGVEKSPPRPKTTTLCPGDFTLDLRHCPTGNGAVVSSAGGCSGPSTPTPTPVTCCHDITGSDPDLTSQQSCLASHNSSDDQLSLLGD